MYVISCKVLLDLLSSWSFLFCSQQSVSEFTPLSVATSLLIKSLIQFVSSWHQLYLQPFFTVLHSLLFYMLDSMWVVSFQIKLEHHYLDLIGLAVGELFHMQSTSPVFYFLHLYSDPIASIVGELLHVKGAWIPFSLTSLPSLLDRKWVILHLATWPLFIASTSTLGITACEWFTGIVRSLLTDSFSNLVCVWQYVSDITRSNWDTFTVLIYIDCIDLIVCEWFIPNVETSVLNIFILLELWLNSM